MAHGFVASRFRGGRPSALHNAVYEGAATVLERDRVGSDPPWRMYLDDETMARWASELAALPLDYDARRWKLRDEEAKRSWTVYRTGTRRWVSSGSDPGLTLFGAVGPGARGSEGSVGGMLR